MESNNGSESRNFSSSSSSPSYSSESRSAESRYDSTPIATPKGKSKATGSNAQLKQRLQDLKEELELRKQIAELEDQISGIDKDKGRGM